MRHPKRTNQDWKTPDSDFRWEHVAIEVLQDIRQELRGIHQLLRCYRIPRAMDAMQRIDKRLAQTHKLKGGRSAKSS